MPPRQQQQSAYDSVFNFIFAHQKKPTGKRQQRKQPVMPSMGDFGDLLGQVAAAPWMYPLSGLTDTIEGELDTVIGVEKQPIEKLKFAGGIGSFSRWLTDPRAMIAKSYKKYDIARKQARIGFATELWDSVAVALYAKFGAGLDSRDAWRIGESVYSVKRSYLNPFDRHLTMQRSQREYWDNSMFNVQNAYGFGHGGGKYAHISRQALEHMVADSRSAKVAGRVGGPDPVSKTARTDDLVNRLKVAGVDEPDAKGIAQTFWGDPGDDGDVGIWDDGNTKAMTMRAEKSLRQRLQYMINNEKDPRKREKLINLQNWLGTRWKGRKGLLMNLGRTVGGTVHVYDWLKDVSSGRLLSGIMLGDMGDLKNAITSFGYFNFDYGTLLDDKNDAYGLVGGGGVLFVSNSVIGKFAEAVNYLHPYNFVKGLVWDGRLWARLAYAFKKNKALSGALSKIAGFTPKQLMLKLKRAIGGKIRQAIMGVMKKMFQEVLEKTLKMAWEQIAKMGFKEIIKHLLIELITQLVGNTLAPGVGVIIGIALDVIISIGTWIAGKLIKPLLEFLFLMLWGLIAIIGVILFGGIFGDDEGGLLYYFHNLNPPITDTGGIGDDEPAEWSEEDIPDDYYGKCIAPGETQKCTQGSHGLLPDKSGPVSTYHQNARAVDISLRGGTAIVAPNDGTVVIAQYVSSSDSCPNYGGTVAIKETSEPYYTWRFIHVKPNVIVGQTVSAGQVVGFVNDEDEVIPGPGCWTGAHVDVTVKDSSGKYLDSEEVLKKIGCDFDCHP